MNTAQYRVDLKTKAFGESLLTQIEDPESEISSYFSNLTVKFVLENLNSEDDSKFLELLDKNQDEAFNFASQKISGFTTKLTNYLQKHLEDIKNYLLP